MYARKVAKNYRIRFAGILEGTTEVCMQQKSMQEGCMELGQTECKKSIKQLLKKECKNVARN